jgi:tetratricopeptide (TPR) repeat protein
MRKTTAILAILTGVLLLAGAVWGQNQPRPKTQKELDSLRAIDSAPSVEVRLQKIDDFLTSFPNSDYRDIVLDQAVQIASDKGSYPDAMAWGQRDLDANPTSYIAMLSLATVTARNTKEFDLDKDQKLAQAEKWANGALDALKAAKRPFFIPEEKWPEAQKAYEASSHQALGMIAFDRKKYDAAAAEYRTAFDLQPEPSYLIRQGEADIRGTKYDDAIAAYDKVLAMPDVNPVVKGVAEREKRDALRRKGVPATAPATAPAPSPVTPPATPPPTPPAADSEKK